jgi:hypothetical protein
MADRSAAHTGSSYGGDSSGHGRPGVLDRGGLVRLSRDRGCDPDRRAPQRDHRLAPLGVEQDQNGDRHGRASDAPPGEDAMERYRPVSVRTGAVVLLIALGPCDAHVVEDPPDSHALSIW